MPHKDPDVDREYKRAYRQKLKSRPGFHEANREWYRQYYSNPDNWARRKESARKSRAKKPEKYRAIRRRAAVKHKEAAERKRLQKYQERVLLLMELKSNPCVDCGGRFHHAAMDFDHVSDDKSFCIASRKATVSVDRLKEEIAKCELVCANCHRVRTWKRCQNSDSPSGRKGKQYESLCDLPLFSTYDVVAETV